MIRYIIALLALALTAPAIADPLFESDEPLAFTLAGPLRLLNSERDKEISYQPATITIADNNGALVTLPIKLKPRGNRRLDKGTCGFSPLRINFKKSTLDDTVFDKQDKIKLVVPCRPDFIQYHDYVITEYLSYKILNLLTDLSYRARLANVTFVDDEKGELHSSYAFFFEANKRLAKRIDRDYLQIPETDATKLDGQHLNLVSLFQFLIANTDWSATHGGNEECCHNGKLYGDVMGEDNLYIPYDFDMTGLVNPEYAAVSIELKLDSIRERRYRGYCRNLEHLPQNIALFNAKKAEIIALFQDSPHLRESTKKRKIAYIEKFYGIINKPSRVKRYLEGWCHKSEMVATN